MSRSQFERYCPPNRRICTKTTGFEETASNLKETALFSPINKEPLLKD